MSASWAVLQAKWSWLSHGRWLALAVVAIAFTLTGRESGAIEPTGSMAVARIGHAAATLPDGRVLIIGGHTAASSISSMTAGTEIYDPATGVFTATGPLVVARGDHAAVSLADGRVLVVGGLGLINGAPETLNNAEIYDPATGTWMPAGAMGTARRLPIARALPDGRVLVLGGDETITSTEIFDPQTGFFTATGSLVTPRDNPTVVVLNDGRVLLAGGHVYPGNYSATAEIWDPATGLWSPTGSMVSPRAYASATPLPDGQVLIAGGYFGSGFPAAAEVFDPVSGTFAATGPLSVPRMRHAPSALADGSVIVSGGLSSGWVATASIERYDPLTGTWRSAGSLLTARDSHTTSLLASGEVLIAGGYLYPGPIASAEIFDPTCSVATPAIAPASASFPASGGVGSVSVMQPPGGCPWRVTRLPSWITITSGSPGVGDGTVTYSVAANTNNYGRGATLRIADNDYYVSQAASVCDPAFVPTLSPTSQSIPASGGSGSISVTNGAGCAWTVSSVPAWMTITSGASGTGSGTVTYSVAANTGASRGATLLIAGKSFSLSQAAPAPVCDPAFVPTLSPTSQSFPASGGSGSVSVTNGAGCAWTVSNVPAWMTITSGASGTGSGTVNYSVAANTGASRSATLSIASKSFVASQAAAGSASCNLIGSTTPGVTYGGSLATTDCTAGSRGTSYYTDRYSFDGTPGQQIAIQLSSTAFDTYVYLRNPGGTVIASNDDGGGGTNSRIPASTGYFTLPTTGVAGTYVIEVTSYYQRATGAYTLLRTQK